MSPVGDIGETKRRIILVPMPEDVPLEEPSPVPAEVPAEVPEAVPA